jgi:excisionase family DNA binding protein
MEDKLLTVEEVAKKLGISTSWVYKKCIARIMPHIKIGATTRFSEKDLQEWLNAHKIKGALKV